MDKSKLDRWAELLLDTGKRNNLINFKDTKSSTAEVLLPDAKTLFDKIEGSTSYEVFDPKNAEHDFDYDSEEQSEESAVRGKDAFYQKYSSYIKKQSQLLVYSIGGSVYATLKKIDKRAKEFIEETGVNVAYMAFGFVHWKESDSSHYELRAPLLLVSIQMERESAIDPYFIHSTEDDIIVNPTFSYLLDAEYGIKLPEYTDEGLEGYLSKVADIVSKLGWSVSSECKIGIFSFLKINMYRDLKDNADAILKNENVRLLLGEHIESKEVEELGSGNGDVVQNPLIDLHNVVDADSSQIEAIEMAKAGKSFVLQGPPGTGKSQTITNIIAECLADGKKVLFVSEKLAALNVVYEKLKQAGLEEFCLELHSHKSNKKAVIEDLCHTLRKKRSVVSAKADAEIAAKEKAQKQLDLYAEELHKERPGINKSAYRVFESYYAYRYAPDVDCEIPDIQSKDESYVVEVGGLIEQYVDYNASIGYDYHKNPWYGYINQDTSYQTKENVKNDLHEVQEFLVNLIPLGNELIRVLGISNEKVSDLAKWQEILALLKSASFVSPKVLNVTGFQSLYDLTKRLKEFSEKILSARDVICQKYEDSIFNVDGEDRYNRLTKLYSGSFSRMFNQEYKQLISEYRLCKKDGKKLSYTEAVEISKVLAELQKYEKDFDVAAANAGECFGSGYLGLQTDWDNAINEMSKVAGWISDGTSFGSLAAMSLSDYQDKQNSFADYENQLASTFAIGDAYDRIGTYFNKDIFDFENVTCKEALQKCNGCLDEIEKIDNWCRFRSLLSMLENKQVLSFIDKSIEDNVESGKIVDSFKKRYYYQWINNIVFESPVLSDFNRISQDNAVKTFAEKDVEQFEINKAIIKADLSANRPAIDMIAPGSALSVLLREGEKKRRQKSIRNLLLETGELVQIIKPCFLMSPLSVSTFLDSDSIHFDVVVFDEASQIFPQDAIGAIYRGDQLIVVGDSKQMPPSNFFNSVIEVEDRDEETGDITDFESILDLCSTALPQLRLKWHYRSRFEQLISFSNKNYYDNDLVTFPSAKAAGKGVGVDYFYVNGIFDRKSHTNRKEAEFIVDLIYKNIEKYPERSLGVVAFSVAQQNLIDNLLLKRRQETPEKEYFFKAKEKEPFFIKNLETVQGDERDTIIFSVAYGIDVQGRLLHNFGPLNRVGGERRLNVAVTRAKSNVQLVSSMHYTDIDLKRTSAEGARLLREYLDYAENGDIALQRSLDVNPFEQFDSEFEMEVCDFLRENGFSVDTQVGCSGFRIDLGLKHPDSSDYVLAIECDGATYHSSRNARDRDRLRQEILERMGWRFYRIWSTDWFKNKQVEKERLLEAATTAVTMPNVKTESSRINVQPEDKIQFEEVVEEKQFEFPIYKVVNIEDIFRKQSVIDYKGMVKEVLDTEAPLSEEFLMKRTVHFFGREKVTSYVQSEYRMEMYDCEKLGIIRKNGFLYLEGKDIFFRAAGDTIRDVKYIATEELADGILQIIKQNISLSKEGLYKTLALQCGIKRVGKGVNELFDKALNSLQDQVYVGEDMISLK